VTTEDIKLRTETKTKEFYVTHGFTSPPSSGSSQNVPQPPYMFGSTQLEMFLDTSSDYYIIPSLKNRKQSGTYFLTIYSEEDFHLKSFNVSTSLENEACEKCKVGNKEIHLTNKQYYEKVEEVRERIQLEAQHLHLTTADLARIFPETSPGSGSESKISRTEFKRKLLQLGFSLSEFPDEDFIVLDADNNGFISKVEFLEFFSQKYEVSETGAGTSTGTSTSTDQMIEPPPDDLLYQAIDLAGQLSVHVNIAKGLRKASTWFTPSTSPAAAASAAASNSVSNSVSHSVAMDSTSAFGGTGGAGPKTRPSFQYSIEDAIKSRSEPLLKSLSYPPSRPSRYTTASKKLTTANPTAVTTPAATSAAPAPVAETGLGDSKLSLQATAAAGGAAGGGAGGGGGGDLNIDTSAFTLDDENTFQTPPKTYFSIRKSQKAMTTISRSTPLKHLSLHSQDDSSLPLANSLPKIHTDQLLVKTEVHRMQALSKWREKLQQQKQLQQRQQQQQLGSVGGSTSAAAGRGSGSGGGGGSTSVTNSSILINPHCFKKKSVDISPSYAVYKFLGVTWEGYQQLFPGVTAEDEPDLHSGNSVDFIIQKYAPPSSPSLLLSLPLSRILSLTHSSPPSLPHSSSSLLVALQNGI
jgi:hypothetical protein